MSINNFLQTVKKNKLSILPTPIHLLKNISSDLGVNIWCMRDDLTGFAFGGNKTRKLDYLMADAVSKGAEAIIAVGANQSNFCRMAAAAASVHNMKAHLILAGSSPEKPTGNLLLDQMFGATIHHIPKFDFELIADKEKEINKLLLEEGKKVYHLPLGGSTTIGTLGYVNAFNEILHFQGKKLLEFNTIFVASGSAGTQAGLVLGKALSDWDGQIIGIAAGVGIGSLRKQIEQLATDTAKSYQLDCEISKILLDENYVGQAYGIPSREGKEAIQLFAQKEGIVLDEVYTAKAAAGMLDYISLEKIEKNSNVLFIHTGGAIQLFE